MTAAKHRKKGRASREEKGCSGGTVNLEVDTGWEVVQNATLSRLEGQGLEHHFEIRVMKKPGRISPTQEFLVDICHDENEFGGLLAKVKGLLRSPREDHRRFSEPGHGVGKGTFEFKAKGKKFRLFFFYGEDCGLASTLVVTTHGFSKKKSSTEEQDREFERAARIRDEFLAQGGAHETP